MKKHLAPVIKTWDITHDVKCFKLLRNFDYAFEPGQATEVSLNRSGWEEKKRPFTFTSLPGDDELELTIKMYPDHQGVTNEMQHVGRGDELILHEVFGAIKYQGEGVFLAGGAGITPFISILRMLEKEGKKRGAPPRLH